MLRNKLRQPITIVVYEDGAYVHRTIGSLGTYPAKASDLDVASRGLIGTALKELPDPVSEEPKASAEPVKKEQKSNRLSSRLNRSSRKGDKR